MQAGRLGVPEETKHRHKRGWILLGLIAMGGLIAAALWLGLEQSGPKRGTPPPPPQHARAEAKGKTEQVKPDVNTQKASLLSDVTGIDRSNTAVTTMIRQVQAMQGQVKQLEARNGR
jgi:hypothetical protein